VKSKSDDGAAALERAIAARRMARGCRSCARPGSAVPVPAVQVGSPLRREGPSEVALLGQRAKGAGVAAELQLLRKLRRPGGDRGGGGAAHRPKCCRWSTPPPAVRRRWGASRQWHMSRLRI